MWQNAILVQSLFSLSKYNNGFFKSAKQREFISDQLSKTTIFKDLDEVEQKFGIALNDGEYAYLATGYVNVAYKVNQPIARLFVIDEYGIVSINKLRYSKNSIDPHKTEKNIWYRDDSQIYPTEVTKEIKTYGNFVGNIGDWVEDDLYVKSIKYISEGPFGMIFKTTLENTNKDILVYWGVIKNAVEKETIKIRFKIKKHEEINHQKITTIGYPKIKS
jgi:hypothetical protein